MLAVRTDISKSFIRKGSDPTALSNWQELREAQLRESPQSRRAHRAQVARLLPAVRIRTLTKPRYPSSHRKLLEAAGDQQTDSRLSDAAHTDALTPARTLQAVLMPSLSL
jgi:hypothetical protein